MPVRCSQPKIYNLTMVQPIIGYNAHVTILLLPYQNDDWAKVLYTDFLVEHCDLYLTADDVELINEI